MKYHGTLRRRARQLRRFAEAIGEPQARGGALVPAFWWDGHPNFGDDLTPWLLPHYGVLPVHRVASRARLAGVGSILEFLPADWDGVVWGSGLMHDAPQVVNTELYGRLAGAEHLGNSYFVVEIPGH